jgi:hypothetical protein
MFVCKATQFVFVRLVDVCRTMLGNTGLQPFAVTVTVFVVCAAWIVKRIGNIVAVNFVARVTETKMAIKLFISLPCFFP